MERDDFYVYDDLDKPSEMIRLLRILSTDTQIYCDLQMFLLTDSPVFTALSYMWGDPSVTESLVISGQLLPVTDNLANALRDVYHFWSACGEDSAPSVESTGRWLWADAICINQQNVLEKNAQVPLMQQIYTKAEHVISWLGEIDERTHDGLEALAFIFDSISMLDGSSIALAEIEEASFHPIALNDITSMFGPENLASFARLSWLEDYCQAEATETSPTDLFQPIHELFRLPYWQRIWTYQEMVLAGDLLLMCGGAIVNWSIVSTVIFWVLAIRQHHSILKCPKRMPPIEWYTLMDKAHIIGRCISINEGRWLVRYREDNAALESSDCRTVVASVLVIMSMRISATAASYRATDPKDYVYGMSGVIGSCIRTDYSAAHSVAQVYHDYVSEWFVRRVGAPGQSFQDIEVGPKLWFLDLAGIGFPRQSFPGMSSWAANFAGAAAARLIEAGPETFRQAYGTCGEGLFADNTPVPQLGKGIL